tara:strand:+ start:148 stop:582 length:435 start_codon:yes stop_codon:yes gene_type:complete
MEKDIQFKLIPLPLESQEWIAHCQIGKHGEKSQGDYVSHQFIIPNELAQTIQGGSRSFSFRLGSTETYYRADQYVADDCTWLTFNTNSNLNGDKIIGAVIGKEPFDEELENKVMKGLEDVKEKWLEKQETTHAKISKKTTDTIH